MQKETKSQYLVELAGSSVLAALFFAFIYYLYFYQPVAFVFFIGEDCWSENATFVLWIFTFLMLVWRLVKHREFRKPGHFVLASAAFLIAMEEISWGQRFIHIESTGLFQAKNLQGEVNLHNFAGPREYYPYIGPLLLLGSFILPVLARLSVKLKYYCSRFGIPIVSTRHWPFFILPIYFLDFVDYLIPITSSYELAELSLAVAVSVMTLDWVMKMRRGQRAYGATAVLATIGMIGTVCILTAPMVRLLYDLPLYKYTFDYVVNLEYICRHRYRQAELLLDYMDRHPEYLGTDSHYTHGLVLLKLGRNEEARQILEKALQEQEQWQQADRENPEPHRVAGKILYVLDRIVEAEKAYLQAVVLDLKRLSKITDLNTGATIRWSLAKTLFAMGRNDAAEEQIQQAVEITPLMHVREDILRWIRKAKETVADLLPSEMANIEADLPPIPGNKYLEERLVTLDPRELKWSLRFEKGNVAKLVFPPDDPDGVRIAIEKAETKTSFDIQLNQPNLSVKSNQRYTLYFRARADSPRSIIVGFAKNHKPWTNLGLYSKIELTSEWQSFKEDFTATGSDNNGRIHFDLGGSDISIDLSGVVLLSLPDD